MMKYRPVCIKTLVFILAAILRSAAFSQSTDDTTRIKIKPGFFVGFETGISQYRIITEGIGSMEGMKSVQGNSFSGTVETGYFFSGGFGLSTGIGIYTSNNTINLEDYSNKFSTTDSENDFYERRISGSAITENLNLSCLKIPLMLNLRIPGRSIFSVYLEAGINLSVPLKKDYSSSGLFSFTGYYPEFNVLLKDLPEYGFVSNAAVSSFGEPVFKTYFLEGVASAGFQFLIAGKIQLSAGASYSRSLTDIADYREQINFQLASDSNSINSMLGGSNSSITESMGLRLSLRYFFKGYRIKSEQPQEQ